MSRTAVGAVFALMLALYVACVVTAASAQARFPVHLTTGHDGFNASSSEQHLHVYAYGGNDRVATGFGSDVIEGMYGWDVLEAGPGNDTLIGGMGADVLHGGPGWDVCRGNSGADTYIACEVIS